MKYKLWCYGADYIEIDIAQKRLYVWRNSKIVSTGWGIQHWFFMGEYLRFRSAVREAWRLATAAPPPPLPEPTLVREARTLIDGFTKAWAQRVAATPVGFAYPPTCEAR